MAKTHSLRAEDAQESSSDDSGDITGQYSGHGASNAKHHQVRSQAKTEGIIEADSLSLEEVDSSRRSGDASGSAWHVSALTVRKAQPAAFEDEDGDLVLAGRASSSVPPPPDPTAVRLAGWRVKLRRIVSSNLERVGLQLWAGALVLSDWLLTRPDLITGRRVCELGAGLGLCSILAAKLGASQVLCTDGHPETVQNCEFNFRENGVLSEQVHTGVLVWDDPPVHNANAEGGANKLSEWLWASEVVVAADVVYDALATEAFVNLVDQVLRQGRAEIVFLAVEKRIYFSAVTLEAEVVAYPQFLQACAARHLVVKRIDLAGVPVHFDYVRSRYYELVEITSKPLVVNHACTEDATKRQRLAVLEEEQISFCCAT